VVLRGEDAHACGGAEDDQVENEDQLIGDRHAGKRIRTHSADHEIVEEVYEIRDGVLHHHGDGDRQQSLIESFVFFCQIQCHVFFLSRV